MLKDIDTMFGGFMKYEQIGGSDVVAVANTLQDDYNNIRKNVGILPMTFTTYFRVSGGNAEDVLDSLLTKSIQYLNYGQNRLCYFLDSKGEIVAFVTVYKNDDNFIIEAFDWAASAVEGILAAQDVSVDKLDYSCILLEGLGAMDFMSDALDLAVDYFVYQGHQELECCGVDVLVARAGYTGEFGYKIIGNTDSMRVIWQKLLPAHRDKLAGYDAFAMCQYEVKQPAWDLQNLSLSCNVFEVDYQWMVDFKKDTDYVGKDALYNDVFPAAKRAVVGAIGDCEVAVGSDVIFEGVVVGCVADCRYALGLGRYIIMLFVEKEYAHTNVIFDIASGNGVTLTTASAPYIFPGSWTARR